MAYPIIDAPYGFKPVNLTGGLPFAGATRMYSIASATNPGLFNGDLVELTSSGVVRITSMTEATTTAVAGQIGVFLGCSFTNPTTRQITYSQNWVSGTVASDAMAYVCDDPNAVFKVVNVAGTTADGAASGLLPAYVARTVIGNNATLVKNTGLTSTGNSRMAVVAGTTTTTLPFRVIDVVTDTANASGNFVELLVRWNFGHHSYLNVTGV